MVRVALCILARLGWNMTSILRVLFKGSAPGLPSSEEMKAPESSPVIPILVI